MKLWLAGREGTVLSWETAMAWGLPEAAILFAPSCSKAGDTISILGAVETMAGNLIWLPEAALAEVDGD